MTFDDGSRLWLRYDALPPAVADRVRPLARRFVIAGDSATTRLIRAELAIALPGLLGVAVPEAAGVTEDGTLLVGTPASSADIRSMGWESELAEAGAEGFLIRSTTIGGKRTIVVASQSDAG